MSSRHDMMIYQNEYTEPFGKVDKFYSLFINNFFLLAIRFPYCLKNGLLRISI